MALNRQETFNTVVTKLFAQGEQAYDPAEDVQACVYRSPEGLKCAVGHLIPDDKYDPSWEGGSIRSNICVPLVNLLLGTDYSPVDVSSSTSFPYAPVACRENEDVVFLAAMQEAHDSSYNWEDSESLKDAFRAVADRFSLDTAIVDTAPVMGKLAASEQCAA